MFDELTERIDNLCAELRGGRYEGRQLEVLETIRAATEALIKAHGGLGPWEAEELAYAEAAIHANWLLLALVATEKALAVSQLPKAEYDYGFNYAKPAS